MSINPDAPDPFAARRAVDAADPAMSRQPAGSVQDRIKDLGLDRWSPEDLIILRNDIESRLPVKSLKDTDLEKELVLQMVTLQRLQQEVLLDPDKVPANQRAQVANSLSSALTNLVKRQADVYTTERFKLFEALLVEFLEGAPDDETKAAWYTRWEAVVRKATGG